MNKLPSYTGKIEKMDLEEFKKGVEAIFDEFCFDVFSLGKKVTTEKNYEISMTKEGGTVIGGQIYATNGLGPTARVSIKPNGGNFVAKLDFPSREGEITIHVSNFIGKYVELKQKYGGWP